MKRQLIIYSIKKQKLQNKIKHNPYIAVFNNDLIIELVFIHAMNKKLQLKRILLTWLISDTDRQTYKKHWRFIQRTEVTIS